MSVVVGTRTLNEKNIFEIVDELYFKKEFFLSFKLLFLYILIILTYHFKNKNIILMYYKKNTLKNNFYHISKYLL